MQIIFDQKEDDSFNGRDTSNKNDDDPNNMNAAAKTRRKRQERLTEISKKLNDQKEQKNESP